MNKNTLKAIARRVNAGLERFTIGRYTYFVNYDRKTIIHHFGSNPQITRFDELPKQ